MTDLPLLWEQPDWLEKAHAWIHAQLDGRGIRVTGPIEQFHIRPWSTVMRVPAANMPAADLPSAYGLFYFKATMPALSYEPALTQFLASFRPQRLPDLLSVDLPWGWMLMRDSGTPLRAFIKAEKSLARWQAILPLYVELQKALMPRTGQLLALGVLDRRLETLPGQFERLVTDEPAMLVGQPDSLTHEEYQQLRASGATFENLCAELASFDIPSTIHHDDFHDANVFVLDGQVRFTDWGESAVTHPFFTLVVLLRGASNSLDLAPDAPELAQLRDWYLSQWTDYAPMSVLQRLTHLAERIGLVNRALTWHRVISSLPDALKPDYAIAVPAYLQEFINTA